MRYSYKFKRKCVELYRQGQWPETPEGISQRGFRNKVFDWSRMEETCGPEALRHKNHNKVSPANAICMIHISIDISLTKTIF